MLKGNLRPVQIALSGAALPVLLLLGCISYAQEPIRLIAHRGGIVDCHHPEDSPGAAKAAIRKGYWMLEIDLQESKDGHIVVHHDDFQKSFGVLKLPGEMTWDEIRLLRAVEDHSHPMDFSQLAALCKGKVRLMIDTKPPRHSKSFYESVEETLRQGGLLKGAYFIGTAESRAYFKGKARISISRDELQKKLAVGEEVTQDYFLFEHGTTLDESGPALAKRAGIPLVVTINDDHYAGKDHMIAAHDDIVRARSLGVTYFQIDSDYDIWLK
jgi:glycerophosphoryl diester phosphodiesterase